MCVDDADSWIEKQEVLALDEPPPPPPEEDGIIHIPTPDVLHDIIAVS